jgi:hypothetical protein
MKMKRTMSILAAGLLVFGCNQQDKKPDEAATPTTVAPALTTISWIDSTTQDLGKVNEGAQVEITYRFRNTGTNPLVVKDVRAGCGCTVPEKPNEPIAPGQEGKIRATFNSSGRSGPNHKEVMVDANTQPLTTILAFKVEVTPTKK